MSAPPPPRYTTAEVARALGIERGHARGLARVTRLASFPCYSEKQVEAMRLALDLFRKGEKPPNVRAAVKKLMEGST